MTDHPSADEQVGFHKGSIATLSKERAELGRILGIVDQLLSMHVVELKKLGVNLDHQQPEAPVMKKDKKPIEDII